MDPSIRYASVGTYGYVALLGLEGAATRTTECFILSSIEAHMVVAIAEGSVAPSAGEGFAQEEGPGPSSSASGVHHLPDPPGGGHGDLVGGASDLIRGLRGPAIPAGVPSGFSQRRAAGQRLRGHAGVGHRDGASRSVRFGAAVRGPSSTALPGSHARPAEASRGLALGLPRGGCTPLLRAVGPIPVGCCPQHRGAARSTSACRPRKETGGTTLRRTTR